MRTGIRQGNDGPDRKLTFKIETLEDYALANRRVDALTKGSKDHGAQQELNALRKAIEAWDNQAERSGSDRLDEPDAKA